MPCLFIYLFLTVAPRLFTICTGGCPFFKCFVNVSRTRTCDRITATKSNKRRARWNSPHNAIWWRKNTLKKTQMNVAGRPLATVSVYVSILQYISEWHTHAAVTFNVDQWLGIFRCRLVLVVVANLPSAGQQLFKLRRLWLKSGRGLLSGMRATGVTTSEVPLLLSRSSGSCAPCVY